MRFANKSTIQSFTLLDLTLTFFDPKPPRFFLHDPTETKKKTALLLQNQTQNWDFFRNRIAKTAIKSFSERLQIWYSLKSTLPGSKISSCSGTRALLRQTNPRFTLSLSPFASFLPSGQSINGPKDISFNHWFFRKHDRNIHRSNQIKPWLQLSFLLRFGQPIKGPKDTSSNHWLSVSITEIP